MATATGDRTLSRVIVLLTWLVALGVPLLLAGSLLRATYLMRSRDRIEPQNHVHLLSGITGDTDEPLFLLDWDPLESAFHVVPQKVEPVGLDGAVIDLLRESDVAHRDMLVGRYIYRFGYSPAEPGGSEPRLRWELIGVRVRVGDTVGRSPSFQKNGYLSYEPDREGGHDLPLWMNGMPSNAFTVLRADSCAAKASGACLEIGDAVGRITLERAGVTPAFTHLRDYERVAVGSNDTLWIANLPYRLSPVDGSKDFNFVLPDDFEHLRGDRTLLGAPGLNGAVERDSSQIAFEDITAQFKEHHVDERRWEPETEDELQLLIDSGLLCMTYERGKNEAIIPQVKWADLTAGSCTDPLGQGLVHSPRAIDQHIIEIYERHRIADHLVARTNEIFERDATAPPGDFPLEFEWWPVQTGSGWTRMPVRVWGVRTGSTQQVLNPDLSSHAASDVPTEEVVLRSRKGDETVLAYTQAGQRNYTDAVATLGLGPLLGERDRIDGVDEISYAAIKRSGGKLALTIDPDLQTALWSALKNELGALGEHPDTYNQSPHYGITGIAMDAQNGNVLATLNWPSGLIWENRQKLQQVENRSSWGVPIGSLNGAMMRADKVGSVFKLLTIYTMADASQLDRGMGEAGPSCGGSKGSPAYVAALFTRNGKVTMGEKPFEDAQTGPLPTGSSGLSGGLNAATAASCNSYFTLAATLLLDSAPPHLKYLKECPVNDKMRRTDTGRDTSREWLLCDRLAKKPQKGAWQKHVHWLLLPEGEDSLAAASRKPFLDDGGAGYFKTAVRAGLRLGFPNEEGALTLPSALDYESFPFRQDWMRGLPGADHHVFVYPMMFSPLSFFGGGQEKFGTETYRIPALFSWREFASQAIGENGQGSALSVATLYSAIGRNDGAIPAPRLVDAGEPSTMRVFDPSDIRLKRIREALQLPFLHGTATEVGRYLSENHIEHVDLGRKEVEGIYGKTGTFVIEFREERAAQRDAEPVPVAKEGCGFVSAESLLSPAPVDSHLLGTSVCERGHLMVTGVQRYPTSPITMPEPAAGAPQASTTAPPRKETHTTFVVVMQQKQSGHPVVFALIVDMDEYSAQKLNARNMSEPLLQAIWNWMQ